MGSLASGSVVWIEGYVMQPYGYSGYSGDLLDFIIVAFHVTLAIVLIFAFYVFLIPVLGHSDYSWADKEAQEVQRGEAGQEEEAEGDPRQRPGGGGDSRLGAH